MSRIIIKNLPKIEEAKLRKLFSPHGSITDLKLYFKPTGEFRHFACIGYSDEESPTKAIEALNNTNVKGQTISVQLFQEEFIKSSKGFKQPAEQPKKPKLPSDKFDDKYTVKLRGIPKGTKKSGIKRFFKGLKITSLRIPRNFKVQKNQPNFAYVKFENAKDLKLALNKDKSVMDGSQVQVTLYETEKPKTKNEVDLEEFDTSRFFIRNLAYTVTEDDIAQLFESYGPLTEVKVPYDDKNKRNKGIAFVTFPTVEKAQEAYVKMDRSVLQGRLLHILPGLVNESEEANKTQVKETDYKAKKLEEAKKNASNAYNWNTFYIGPHAISKLLNNTDYKSNRAVDQALLEVNILDSIKKYFFNHEINLEAVDSNELERSNTAIIIKNLNADTDPLELRSKFQIHGKVKRFVSCPKYCLIALVEFEEASSAKKAFKELAYSQFYSVPLFLEWAPKIIFEKSNKKESEDEEESDTEEDAPKDVEMKAEDEPAVEAEPDFKLYVKNISFETSDQDFTNHFTKVPGVSSAIIARDKATGLSRGFGFVMLQNEEAMTNVLRKLQGSKLNEHDLQLERSKQEADQPHAQRKKPLNTVQVNSKILVKNLPFEADLKDLTKLFQKYGKVRVKIPKKATGERRGFGFVHFENKTEAKTAFKSLKDVHLYGRRLALEWALN